MSADLTTAADRRARYFELLDRGTALLALPTDTDEQAATYWEAAADLDEAFADLWSAVARVQDDVMTSSAIGEAAALRRSNAREARENAEKRRERIARHTGEAGTR